MTTPAVTQCQAWTNGQRCTDPAIYEMHDSWDLDWRNFMCGSHIKTSGHPSGFVLYDDLPIKEPSGRWAVLMRE